MYDLCMYDLRLSFRCRRRCLPRPVTRRRSTTALFSSIYPSCRTITARPATRPAWKVRRSSRRHDRRARDRPRSIRARRIRTANCRCRLIIRTRDLRRDTRRVPTTYPGVLRAPSFILPARNRRLSNRSKGRRVSIFWPFFRNPGRCCDLLCDIMRNI